MWLPNTTVGFKATMGSALKLRNMPMFLACAKLGALLKLSRPTTKLSAFKATMMSAMSLLSTTMRSAAWACAMPKPNMLMSSKVFIGDFMPSPHLALFCP